MDQRSKDLFEITGWKYRLKWLQVELVEENEESFSSVEEGEEDFVSDDDASHPFSQNELNDLVRDLSSSKSNA